LVASAVQGVMAQRLVRVLCPYCKEHFQPDDYHRRILGIKDGDAVDLCRPKGCNECNFTGFLGRIGIFEIFVMNDTLRDLTLRRVSAAEIRAAAIASGMRSMRDDGFEKVRRGMTTLEEVFAVVGEE